MLRRALLLACLVACVVVVSALAPPPFNPLGKKHAVSRSSFHTEQGRTYDMTRAYPGHGTSHTRHALKASQFGVEQGVHLWEAEVYARMTQLAAENLNDTRLLTSLEAAASGVPEQIKLGVTQRAGEVVVNWLTWNTTAQPMVRYGLNSGTYTASVNANMFTWVDPNSMHLIRYIYNALLTGLSPSTDVYYVVGDAATNVWSSEYRMITPGDGSTVQTIAVFGDMGVVNSQSMQLLTQEVAAGQVQMVMHLGDYAYNMDELQGLTGDLFLEEMTNITAAVPYMGGPGNHEQAFNFSHFANKFSLYNYVSDPSGKPDQNWWYSWDFMSGGARVHVLTLDSELYYWDYLPAATPEQLGNFQRMIEAQWNWIVADLTAAYDSGKYDWIMAYSHRPMYCSNVDDLPDCSDDAERLRLGIPVGPNGERKYGFEAALSVRPIDLYMSAHEHSYERTLPVFNGTIDRQADPNFYVDPLYPVHIVTGAGGCREFFDFYDQVFYGPWSIFRSATYGHGHLIVHNSTHMYWEQLIDEGRGGKDTMWIVKKSRSAVRDQQLNEAIEAAREEAEEVHNREVEEVRREEQRLEEQLLEEQRLEEQRAEEQQRAQQQEEEPVQQPIEQPLIALA